MKAKAFLGKYFKTEKQANKYAQAKSTQTEITQGVLQFKQGFVVVSKRTALKITN